MITDIKDYILRSRESGISDNVIKTALINLGHSRAEIEQAYLAVVGPQAKESESYFAPNTNIQFGNQPATPTAEQIAQTELESTQSKKSSKKVLAIIFSVIILLGVGASGFAYYNYLQNRPDNVLAKFNLAWPQIKSFRNNLTLTYLFTPRAESTKQLEFKAESVGSFDFSTSTGARFTDEVRITPSGLGDIDQIGLKLSLVNKNLYLQSWDFSKFPLFDLSGLDGVWIRMNFNSVDSAGENLGIKINSGRVEGMGERFKEEMKNPPMKFVKELPREVIGGIDTYHYLFSLDVKEVQDFAGEVAGLDAEEKMKVEEAIAPRYSNFSTSTLDLWIYKGSYLPAKFLITLEGAGEGSQKDSLKIESIFSDINMPLSISEPNNSQDLQSIFERAMKQAAEQFNASSTSATSTSVATSTGNAQSPSQR